MDLTTKQYRHNKIPIVERPGVYAYHLIPPARLKQIEVEHSRPLYIGRTANLAERNHFEHKTSGFSTLRRSLGALLKDELKLQAIPRDSGKKVYYKFTPRGEKRLTEWMKKNLRYSFEVVDGDVRARESELIEARKPPLNLLGWPNPQSKKIKDLREGCKLEAKKHLITRQANPQETGPSVRTKTSRASSSMVVAGVMSGTSADGVDVAVCRISAGVKGGLPRVKILGHVGFRYSKAVRAAALRVMEGGAVTAAEMSRLNWRLGEIYADCVEKACAVVGVGTSEAAAKMGHPGSSARLGLVGCHGQTVFHQSTGARWLGKEVRGTWQMGEASVIAERLGVPVVSDFRPADLAAGGQGAPLVPMLDYVMFRSDKVSRVMQNLGGIGNLTAIPAGAGVEGVMAFDTGPGNMVVDECMRRLYGKEMDRGGAVARRGSVMTGVVKGILRERYFSALPPKSCGREEFGAAFVSRFIETCRGAGASDADVVATATDLTAASVVEAYRRFVWAHVRQAAPLAKVEFVVAGGGVKNAALMGMLRERLGTLGVRVREMGELGVEAQAKEAVAFALLGWLTWNGLPGNVPAATGAGRAVILGKVTFT